MDSNGNRRTEEIQLESELGSTSTSYMEKIQSPLIMQTSQGGKLAQVGYESKFLNVLPGHSIRSMFGRIRSPREFLNSSSVKFRQMAEERDEISRSVVASPERGGSPRNFRARLARKINWGSLLEMSKEWIKDPVNMVLLAWIVCVAVSGAILFMVLTGILNHALPKKSQRDTWFEVNNQILNALFTLMCLYQHPKRFYHLALLCRWGPEDVLKLRKIYCKNGTYKPNEWVHMMVVVVLLHINCFAQYALCGLNLGYRRSQRPAIGVAICISVAIAAPAIATVYNIRSPLGKEYETDEEASIQPTQIRLEKRFSFVIREDRRVPEARPEWIGGLFDLWDDLSLAYLSFFCSFCVFGWNMDRLGFGNMYVHIATFVLLCSAPFWIFNLAAININNEAARQALGYSGFILCVFGLLYGGFWRIQMRKKFNLPAKTICCGNAAVTDCFQWLCCCSCSLAQEARTADFYDVVEDKFYSKETNKNTHIPMSPLPREDGSPLMRSSTSSPLWGSSSPSLFRTVESSSPSSVFKDHGEDFRLPKVAEESPLEGIDITMSPPIPSVIQKNN